MLRESISVQPKEVKAAYLSALIFLRARNVCCFVY